MMHVEPGSRRPDIRGSAGPHVAGPLEAARLGGLGPGADLQLLTAVPIF